MRLVRGSRSRWNLAVLALAVVLGWGTSFASDAPASGSVPPGSPLPVDVYVFHGEGCPHCANALDFLADLQDDYPSLRVHDFEVWYDDANRETLRALAAVHGRPVGGVPMIFLGDEVWTGFGASTARQLEDRVRHYRSVAAPDPWRHLDEAAPVPRPTPDAPEPTVDGDEATVTLPLLGRLDLTRTSLVASTAVIALVDGVNPCSLWVLALLLGVVLGTGSRRRVGVVGATFLVITAAVYAAFIAGTFEVIGYLSLLGSIRVAVAVVALLIAAVNLKDYLAFGRGISLTISDTDKPGIYRRVRQVMQAEGSWWTTLTATGALALGVTLVELPCTAGFPVVWTALVADAGVGRAGFGGLLGLYMVIYLLDELVIFGAAVVTLRQTRLGEGGGRVLKLLGGSVMLALAIAMLAAPEALFTVQGTLDVFGIAFGGAAATLILHHVFHPSSSPWAVSAGSRAGGDRGARRRRRS